MSRLPTATPNPKSKHALDHSFGELTVAPAERKARIRRVFAAVAPRYDLMNNLMSFGVHRLWKRALAHHVGTPLSTALALDIAGGTGDIARLLCRHGWQVVVCDPSFEMMQAGRAIPGTPLRWLAGEAEALPLPDASVDLVTVSFGLRNATELARALAEAHRVLRPGGQFFCLEFSRPVFWLRPFYELYSRLVIPRLGAAVAQQPEAYQYLIESIRRFPEQHEFANHMAAAGFTAISWKNLSFGIACLHQGQRPRHA